MAFIAITLAIGVLSNVGQALTSRFGPRRVLSSGLVLVAASMLLYARLPVDGQYFWDLFPALVLGGLGLGLAFVPVTIAAVQGVEPADTGIASGLINTSRMIGGSVGIAAVSTIAASSARVDTAASSTRGSRPASTHSPAWRSWAPRSRRPSSARPVRFACDAALTEAARSRQAA